MSDQKKSEFTNLEAGKEATRSRSKQQKPPDISSRDDIPYDDPFKFTSRKKWTMTVLMALVTFTSTFCSSIFSATIVPAAKEFHTTEEVLLLGVSLFVLGYALGPLLWGPLSELLGRKIPLFVAFFMFGLLQIPIALSPTLAGVLVGRFLAGCFGAAPVALVNAAFVDFWAPTERGVASGLYSAAVYAGPTMGPLVGAFVTESRLGWRWTSWLIMIMVGVFGIPALIMVPETYAPVLKERAAKAQGIEVTKKNPFDDFVRKYLKRPISMLIHEPVVRNLPQAGHLYSLLCYSFWPPY